MPYLVQAMKSHSELTSTKKNDREKIRVRAEIQALDAYRIVESEGLIKLDAMENPYSWPKSMQDEWLENLRGLPLNRYPDPSGQRLKQTLRDTFDIGHEMEILLGNGSDELIQIVQMCMSTSGSVMLSPSPSFVMYEMAAKFVGAKFVGVPLESDFSIDLNAMRTAIKRYDPAVIFLAYPNNPTGNLFDYDAMDEIIRTSNGLVVVDEAYHIYSDSSCYDRLGLHSNLVVMRTLSKLGLAGLRIGFLVGPKTWLNEFEKVRMPYNVGALSQATAEFALQRLDIFEQQAAQIIAERERLFLALTGMSDITPFPSRTNFILFRCDRLPATDLFDRLIEHGILIKNCHQSDPALKQCLRVSIGTKNDNNAFLSALEKCLA